MKKWTRANYMPNRPLYEGKANVTAGPEHLALSREAAGEGMILLKNEDQLLPFSPGQKVALIGKGSIDYVKGGGGSGDVSVAYVRNLYDGFSMSRDSVSIYEPLIRYYRDYVNDRYANGSLPGLIPEPELPEELMKGAAAFTDTALLVFSRFSGEGWDRRSVYYEGQEAWEEVQSKRNQEVFGDTDYYLTDKEKTLLEMVKKHFPKIVVVLNTGAVMDTSWFVHDPSIGAVLLAWQGGMEGGTATASPEEAASRGESLARPLAARPSPTEVAKRQVALRGHP